MKVETNMFYFRTAEQRGTVDFGWLTSHHTFSFGDYYDPSHMGISNLRVLNDDTVAAGAGFGKHGHKDMEIITYVLEGSIEHKDSMGNHFVVSAGDIQRMSAGTGIMHSEYNASKTEPLKFLQIWISPNKKGIKPSYAQMPVVQTTPMTALLTANGYDGSLSMQQDASLYRLQLKAGEKHELIAQQKVGYLHVISGNASSDAYTFKQGDGLGIIQDQLLIRAEDTGLTALWFELPEVL